jgi:hypothetical protein
LTKLSREAVEYGKQQGKLPHEILLDMTREVAKIATSVDQATGEITYGYVIRSEADRRDAAKAAAPYFAPKLSTVETIASMSDAELDEIIRSAAAEAALGPGPAREGEEAEAEDGEGTSSSATRSSPARRRIGPA